VKITKSISDEEAYGLVNDIVDGDGRGPYSVFGDGESCISWAFKKWNSVGTAKKWDNPGYCPEGLVDLLQDYADTFGSESPNGSVSTTPGSAK
jgi:hypothetical protein